MTSLEVRNLEKKYDSMSEPVLNDVSITVVPGELLVLLGPSGSGKTTLLRGIAGLLSPSAGQIFLDGTLVSDGNKKFEIPPYQRNLGMVFQSFALWPHMTVRKNVGFPLEARRWPAVDREKRIDQMLELVKCSHLAERFPSMLSGGQQQRIALARALAARPALVLFDEPLSNLDALLREELRQQLRLIHRETKFTGVYVTHDQTEALSLGTRVAVMNDGKVEQIGTAEEIYFEPKSEFVAKFMGMSNVLSGHAPLGGGAFTVDSSSASNIRFRPEDGRIVTNRAGQKSSDGVIEIMTRVVDRAFVGDSLEYTVSVSDKLLKVFASTGFAPVPIGEDAILQISLDKAKIFQPAI
jgi:iron(III) transport system ATP-binding protein